MDSDDRDDGTDEGERSATPAPLLEDQFAVKELFTKLLRDTGETGLYLGLGAVLTYAMEIVVARWLGADAYGAFAFVVSSAALLAVPATLGFRASVVRFIPEYLERTGGGYLKGITVSSLVATLLGATAMVVLGGGGLILAGIGPDQVSVAGSVVAIGCLVYGRAVSDLLLGLGRGVGELRWAYLPRYVIRPAMIIAGIFIGHGLGVVVGIEYALAMVVGAYLVAMMGQTPVLASLRRAFNGRGRHRWKYWLKVSFPFMILAASSTVINRTDVVMLEMLSESAEVGLYQAASRTAGATMFVFVAMNAMFAPTISRLHAGDRKRELEELTVRIAHVVFWPTLIGGGVLLLWGDWILSFFGTEFSRAHSMLALLVVGNLVHVGTGSVAYFMNMTGHQNTTAWVLSTAAVGNIVLNLILIPEMDGVGAAAAGLVATATWNVVLLVITIKKVGIDPSIIYAVRGSLR